MIPRITEEIIQVLVKVVDVTDGTDEEDFPVRTGSLLDMPRDVDVVQGSGADR